MFHICILIIPWVLWLKSDQGSNDHDHKHNHKIELERVFFYEYHDYSTLRGYIQSFDSGRMA